MNGSKALNGIVPAPNRAGTIFYTSHNYKFAFFDHDFCTQAYIAHRRSDKDLVYPIVNDPTIL